MTSQISNISDSSKLTANQQQLSKDLEDIVYFETPSPNNGDYNHVNIDPIAGKLEKFLRDNERNKDLEYVLNLKKGKSESTVLHNIGHPSAGIDYYAFSDDLDSVAMLLVAGANPNIKNGNGEIPLETAIKSKCYHLTEFLLNEGQKELKKELDNLLEYGKSEGCYADIKKFLDHHKYNKDLKLILNLQTGQFGSTVLHGIVKYDVEVVDLLLKAGADPNIQDTEGKTPLHYAAEYCCTESIDILILDNKANPNIVDELGNTPLHYAIANGDTHSAESLVKAGTMNVNAIHQETRESPIFDAVGAEGDSGRIAELMIKDEKVDLSIKNARGMSVLHKAAFCGRSSTVDLLLHKINPFDLDRAKRSPLHFAALNNLIIENNSIDESHENGFDYQTIETPDANITAIIVSLIGEHMQRIRCEVENLDLNREKLDCTKEEYVNAKKEKYVNAEDENGNTPLFYATESGKIDVVNKLLDEGAKIGVINKEGFTSLHFAIKNRSLNLLEALLPKRTVSDKEGVLVQEIDLLEAKRLLQLKDRKGNTLLHHAVKWGCNGEILNFLVQHGVDINTPNKNGVAPIHIAAKYGRHSQIKFFIDNKADLNLICGKLASSTIEDIGKEEELSNDSLGTYINVQDGNLDASSTVEMEGEKITIEDGRGWSPLHIAIKRASEEHCGGTERKKRLKIVKDLAYVSDLTFLIMLEDIDKWPKTWKSEEIIQILQDARESRNNEKLPNAPIEDKKARAPIFDDSFYSEIGSYVREPDLFSDPSDELSKPYQSEVCNEVGDWSGSVWSSSELNVGAFELSQSQKEELDECLFEISKANSIAELDEIVDNALKDGVRINSIGVNHQTFTDAVIDKVEDFLRKKEKEDGEIAVNIICKLISKGGDVKENWDLEDRLENYKKDIAKAETEFEEYYNNLKKAAEEAVNKGASLEELKIDNTTVCFKYSEYSVVNIAKIVEKTKKSGLKAGNVILGQNIVKIGEGEVNFVIENGIRNYVNLSDNSDITLTFSTSLGKLKVRLRPDTNNRGRVIVEVFDQATFNKLKDRREKIGENCRLGGLSVYEAIDQGCFYNLSDKDSKKTAEETNTVSIMDWAIKTPSQNNNWERSNSAIGAQVYSKEVVKEIDRGTECWRIPNQNNDRSEEDSPPSELNSLSAEKVADKRVVALGA